MKARNGTEDVLAELSDQDIEFVSGGVVIFDPRLQRFPPIWIKFLFG